MSYEKHTWETGETITAEKLNHIESGIKDNENGYSISPNRVTLFNDNITTVGQNNSGAIYVFDPYSNFNFNAEELYITFNNTEYIVQKTSINGEFEYFGTFDVTEPSFTTYPFFLAHEEAWLLLTENEGTYSLKIEVDSTTIETSETFKSVVNDIAGRYIIEVVQSDKNYETVQTGREIANAYESGKQLCILYKTEDNNTGDVYKNYFSIQSISIGYDSENSLIFVGFTTNWLSGTKTFNITTNPYNLDVELSDASMN